MNEKAIINSISIQQCSISCYSNYPAALIGGQACLVASVKLKPILKDNFVGTSQNHWWMLPSKSCILDVKEYIDALCLFLSVTAAEIAGA